MTLMLKFFLVVILAMTANCFTLSAAEHKKVEITIGNETGSCSIPFTLDYEGKPFQQIYAGWLFPFANKIIVEEIGFPANFLSGTGRIEMNLVMRMGLAQANSTLYDLNLGDKSRIVWSGDIVKDLSETSPMIWFKMKGRPFMFDPSTDNLIIHIEVVEVRGTFIGGFNCGITPFVWRVYEPFGGGPTVAEQGSLNTTFRLKLLED